MNDQPADTRLQAFSLFGYATLVGIASVGGYIVFNKPSPIMLRVAASKGGVGREATVVGDEEVIRSEGMEFVYVRTSHEVSRS